MNSVILIVFIIMVFRAFVQRLAGKSAVVKRKISVVIKLFVFICVAKTFLVILFLFLFYLASIFKLTILFSRDIHILLKQSFLFAAMEEEILAILKPMELKVQSR